MTEACDQSQLTIPAVREYVPVAVTYTAAVAAMAGLSTAAGEALSQAVGLALTEVLGRAFEPGERSPVTITGMRVAAGVQVTITEKGLPLVAGDLPSYCQRGEAAPDPAGPRLCDLVEEATLVNRGHGGTEIRLVKYRARAEGRPLTCEAPPGEPAPAPLRSAAIGPFTVRLLQPGDSLEVSRAVYQSYGYSYPFEDMYYPERLVALNAAGRLISAVALTPEGQVAGHSALIHWEEDTKLIEVGLGVVKPEYRAHGCLKELTEFLLQEARKRHFEAVCARTVTSHRYSQRVTAALGFTPCALMLGFAPASLSFRRLQEHLPQRETLLVEYRGLVPPAPVTLYLPERHRDMIQRLYGELGIPAETAAACPAETPARSRSLTHLRSTALPTGTASLIMQQQGAAAVAEVRHQLKALRAQKYDMVFLYLDLADPLTCSRVVEYEAMGFFFAGILPGAYGMQALILQCRLAGELDYERIALLQPAAQALRDYIRPLDP